MKKTVKCFILYSPLSSRRHLGDSQDEVMLEDIKNTRSIDGNTMLVPVDPQGDGNM